MLALVNQTNTFENDRVYVVERKEQPEEKEERNKLLHKIHTPKHITRKSLKDNPQPIKDTPALRNLTNNNKPTEVIKELHPSIIAQPRIDNVKKKNMAERKEEISSASSATAQEKGKTPEEPPSLVITDEDTPMLDIKTRTRKTKTVEAKQAIPKHIRLMDDKLNYDLIDDLNNTPANITFAQLLDVSPKVRAELVKNLKFNKDNKEDDNSKTNKNNKMDVEEIQNNKVEKKASKIQNPSETNHVSLNLIHKGKIAISKCKIWDVPTKVYLDYGAGINLISKEFFDQLPNKPDPIGKSTTSIVQVLSDVDHTPGLIYRLPLTIGSYTLTADFRLVEKTNLLFDILISYETILENYLFINPITVELCKINKDLDPHVINEIIATHKLWDVIERLEPVDRSDETVNDNEDLPEGEVVNLLIAEEHREPKSNEISSGTDRNKVMKEILEKKIDTSDYNLNKELKSLLTEFEVIIAISTDDLKRSKLLPHSIQLKKGYIPIKQRTYRISKVKADILKKELTKLINKRLIVPSHSPWSSPIVIIPKKNGKWRLCIDYRKLNEMTVKDSYSIPFIEEILYSVGGNVKVISTIDLFSGYHQIPMDQKDIDKTCFTTMYGNFNFVVMPFGLTNAPATFQREMNRIFFPLIGKCMFVYLDDLVIFSPSMEQHLIDLREVFEIIRSNGLKINIEKCHFLMKEVEVLGHMLTTNGLKPVAAKVEVIKAWPVPKDLTKLRSFLGTVGYYRKFIPNFAQKARCLYNLLKKDTPFQWTQEHEQSFNSLREYLTCEPILKFPDYSKQFIIRTDASYNGLGGVLIQRYDKMEFPIHYVSRNLKKEEVNYHITKLEGAAAYFSVMKFKPIISGSKEEIILYTDHKPLVGLFKNKQPVDNDRQLTNWVLTFSMLKVVVKYEEGKKNILADALSRIPSEVEKVSINSFSNATPLMNSFINSKIIKIDGVDYYKDGQNLRKVISDVSTKKTLLLEAHNVGHEGIYKTYNRIKRDYYWNDMIKDVKLTVKTCPKCQIFRNKPYPREETIPTPAEAPFVRVGLDLVGPLYVTKRSNQYIIVLVDYFTGWVEASPLKNIQSSDVISFLLDVFCRHGIPEILICDRGPQFISSQTKGFLDIYNVYIQPSAGYHPETNGKVENRNKEISKYLRLLGNQERDWDEILPSALWALRTSKSEKTGFSSFELLYGRRDKQPFELLVNLDQKEPHETKEEYMLRKFIRHRKWVQEAIKNIENANALWTDRRKQRKRMRNNYSAGDLVLIRYLNRRKLDPYFMGPLRVVKSEFNTVTLCDPQTGEILDRNVHKKNLIPYYTLPTSRDEV